MPTPRTEHGSGVVPVGSYAPGAHEVNPPGLSRGVASLPPVRIPPAPTTEPEPVKRRGRPKGSRNRPKIPDDEVFDDPPEPA